MKFSGLYGWGAVLGFSPRAVDDMSLWEMGACIEGYRIANGSEQTVAAPTAEEFLDQVARLG